jgi:predicted glutamine amidotransferase
MCIAIYKPHDKSLFRRTLKECWRCNDDGAGFMWADGEKLYVKKGFYTFRKFYKAYRACEREYPDCDFVLHFRIATSGDMSVANVHPHIVNENVAFVHNGILSEYSHAYHTFSDTYLFNRNILQAYPDKFMNLDIIMDVLDQYCKDELSKMIFMNNTGETMILNEMAGVWDFGCWFSGMSYKTYRYVATKEQDYHQEGYYENWWLKEDMSMKNYEYCDFCSRWLPDLQQYGELWVCDDCRPNAVSYRTGKRDWRTAKETVQDEPNKLVVCIDDVADDNYTMSVNIFFEWLYREVHKTKITVEAFINWVDKSIDVVFSNVNNVIYRVPQAITDEHAGLEELLAMIIVNKHINRVTGELKDDGERYGGVCPTCGELNQPYTFKDIGRAITCNACQSIYKLFDYKAKPLLVCPFCGMNTILVNNECRFCKTHLGETDIVKYSDCIK